MPTPIQLVVFDLAGTLIDDDTAVADCLLQPALDAGLQTTREELLQHLGTNKVHLYQFLIARREGRAIEIDQFDAARDPGSEPFATEMYQRFTELMIGHYRRSVRPIAGAEATLRWCKDAGIRVATDTGFHRDVTDAIMDKLGWIEQGLVDLAVTVDDIPGHIGRPAPFMIYHAMMQLNVQDIAAVAKVGDTAADLLEGTHAGAGMVVGVLTGTRPPADWLCYPHTHVLASVAGLPGLLTSTGRGKRHAATLQGVSC